MKIVDLSAVELNRKLIEKEVGFLETIDAYIGRIEEQDKKLNSYITHTFEYARDKARTLQKRLDEGDNLSDVAGVPFAVKDNMCTKGIPTTCGSKILTGYIPPYTATAVKKLLENDAIIIGKTNMDEFAMGGSNETSFFGPALNPWDTDRVTGGSSGGSAASVSSRTACFALGSDTGGSIRQPSAFCGVVGVKPTYGRVSRYGLVAFASSLDQIGPITRNIQDNSLITGIISGHDEKDQTSSSTPREDYYRSLDPEVKGMKIAYIKECFSEATDHDVKAAVYRSFDIFSDLGVDIDEISCRLNDYVIPVYYILSSAEASSNLSRYDGIKYGHRAENYDDLIDIYVKSRTEGFGSEVKRRIMLGTYALSAGYYDAYYLKAARVRHMIKEFYNDIFAGYDAVIGPVAPTTAYRIGDNIKDPLKMYLGDIFTVTANITGSPAMSVPAGFDKKGLPIGLHIMTDSFNEQKLFDLGFAYQQETLIDKYKDQIMEQ